MPMNDDQIYLGFDPGGERGFGVALIVGAEVRAATVRTVAEAVVWAVRECSSQIPVAAGVDTLLCWSDGPAGWRPADKVLRAAYRAAQASIISPNYLSGSMSIGGMALALRLRERWRNIVLNETHPKLLVAALGGSRYKDDAAGAAIEWFAKHSGLDMTRARGGHQLDAVSSAWATREGMAKGWDDLVPDDSSLLFPAGRASYLWPELPAARISTGMPPPARKTGASIGQNIPRRARGTTAVGFVSRNQQEVVRPTGLPGTDHGQSIYVLRCKVCGHEYGANGSEIWVRRCPKHDGGKPGLSY
jgi:hypothetical protein